MEPWGTPALNGYSYEDFPSRTTWSCLLLRKEEIWLRLQFVDKTSMPNAVKTLGFVKCYSSSSPKCVKSPGNSIRYNCQKISSWSRRPKTILEIRKKTTFFEMINNPIIYKFFKDLNRKKNLTERILLGW